MYHSSSFEGLFKPFMIFNIENRYNPPLLITLTNSVNSVVNNANTPHYNFNNKTFHSQSIKIKQTLVNSLTSQHAWRASVHIHKMEY